MPGGAALVAPLPILLLGRLLCDVLPHSGSTPLEAPRPPPALASVSSDLAFA